MERWANKTAIVTGASSGIGAAIAIDLVKAGMNVVGLARRVERVNDLQQKIPTNCKGKLYAVGCDITKESDIKSAFDWVEQNLGGVDVLINNAGIMNQVNLVDENNSSAIRSTIDTNLLGPVFCTREAFHSMRKRHVDGHIVMINSTLGHKVFYLVGKTASTNIYPSTKFGITAMTEVLRQEFQSFGTRIKITVGGIALELQAATCQKFGGRLFTAFIYDGFALVCNINKHVSVISNKCLWMSEKRTIHTYSAANSDICQISVAACSSSAMQSISPGATKTEIFTEEILDTYPGLPLLQSEDVSAAVLYALGTPPHVQVHELTIRPVGEPF